MAAWAEIMASLVIDSSKAKGDVEKSLKSVDAGPAGKAAGGQFAAGAKPEIESGLKAVDGAGAGKAVGTEFAGAARPAVEGGLRSVDGAGAGRAVGTEFAGAAKPAVEGGLRGVDAAGAGKQIGSTVASGAKPEIEGGLKRVDAAGAGKAVGGNFVSALRAPFAAISGILGPALAIGGGIALFKGMIDQGGAAVKASKVVEAAIKTTGAAAGVTGKQIDEMAGAQARSTGVSKDAIQQSDALLLRFTNVKNAAGENNDVFNRTSQAALDMTAALGKGTVTADGLANSTKILGKALEDPTKAAGALRRSGIDLTKQQQDAIKTMVAHNDTLGAQKVVLDAVNKSYGGTAAATASGSAKMKVALTELEATLGKQLIPLMAALIKAVTQVLDVFGVLVDKFTSSGRAMTVFRDIIIALVAVFAAYTAAVKINALSVALSAKWTELAAKATKLFAVETEGATIATRAQAAAQKILDAELLANPIGLIVVAVAALAIGLYELYKHSQAFRDIVHEAWSVVREIAVPAAHALGDAVHLLGEGLKAVASLIGAVLAPAFRLIGGIFDGARDALTGFIGDWTTSSNIFTGTFAATWNYIAHIASLVGDIVFAPIRAAMTAFSGWWAGSGAQVKQVWEDLWKGLAAVFRLYWDVITANVRAGWAVIQALFEVGAAIVTAAWRVAWLVLSPIFKAYWDVVLTLIRIGWALIKAEFQIGMAVITAVWRIGWAFLGAVLKTEFAYITAVFKIVWDVFAGIFTVGLDLLTGRWGKAWHDMLNVFRQVWNAMTAFLRSTFGAWHGFFSSTLSALTGLWRSAWSAMTGAARSSISAITGLIHGLEAVVKAIPAAFEAAVSGVVNALHHMVSAVAGPVDAITSKLGSIGKVFNSISGAVGLAAKIPSLASGGKVIAGTGETADDVLVRVSRNETVVSAEDSRLPFMQEAFTRARVPGYATGGIVSKAASKATSAAKSVVGTTVSAAAHASDTAVNAAKAATSAAASEIGDVASQVVNVEGKLIDMGKITMALFTGDEAGIHSAFEHLIGDHHPALIKDSMLDQLHVGVPVKMVDEIVGWLKQNGGGANGSTILADAMTYANKVPYVWGGAQPGGWDCSGFVSWIYMKYKLLGSRMVADALQSWGKATPGPVPGGMVFFGRPAHHIGFAIDDSKYLSALGHKWGTIVSSVAGNSGFAIPPTGFDQANGSAGGSGAPGSFMNPGGGAAGWANAVRAALGLMHLSMTLVPQVLHQISTESGGNAKAINNWDSNAAAGIPSKGLLQVIDPTFNAYHVPGTAFNIWDPLANIAAAINYAYHRYGPALMRGSMGLGSGHGYAKGGPINEPVVGIGQLSGELYSFGEQGREWVVPEPRGGASPAAGGGGMPAGVAAMMDQVAAALDAIPGRVADGVTAGLDGVARHSAVGAQWSTR